MATITLNGITFDPEADSPALARAGLRRRSSSSSNYILIQLSRPPGADERGILQELGVELLEFVPTLTYLCRYLPGDLGPVRSLDFVRWAHVFLRDFKVSPELLAVEPAGEELLEITRTGPIAARRRIAIEVTLHSGVDVDEVADTIARAGTGRASKTLTAAGKVKLRASPAKIAAIADLDVVRGIEADASAESCCNVAGEILGSTRVHQALALKGEGEIVGICDTGFDKGSPTDTHPAFSGRILKIRARGGRPGDDPDGHGTHCAGCIAGDGASPLGPGPVTGTAPGARLVVQAVFQSKNRRFGGLPADLRELLQEAFDDGARIHSNSWVKTSVGNRYNADCREIDDFIWSHREMVVVCAVGNNGADRNRNGTVDNATVLPPGVAKNCISVGASESERPTISKTWGHKSMKKRFRTPPLRDDPWADDREGMAAFSGCGPARGGRLCPDLVAPGTAILSTLSRRARAKTLWGPRGDALYSFEGGTSTATPLVAGCAAVARQFLRQRLPRAPSAALVKALLINGASPLRGQFVPVETHGVPNHREGWGRVDLERTVNPAPPFRFALFDEERELDTGGEQVHELETRAGPLPLKVTLVWTDPPGENLQNDLDLIVRDAAGEERHGNAAPGSTGFDDLNNVEQVVWENFAAGSFSVVVRGSRIALHPQSFAVVVRGALA